ncbi:DJ-1/PfpI family protein [Salinisphaera sp. SWV1]|uniref:DJ-1/PfpI family protein n=1 Tax=Salinisphaera sp. SWV1 TaxID=3454139 RepID=UPI003F83D98C
MAGQLEGKKIAFLVADGFEQIELTRPRQDITEAGAQVQLVSLQSGEVQGMSGDIDRADRFTVDETVDEVPASDHYGLGPVNAIHAGRAGGYFRAGQGAGSAV